MDALLAAARRNGVALSRADLAEIVARNDKQRFSFDETGQRIRANQGHSVSVDLQLAPAQPPDALYHGTSKATIEPILREGLRKMRRQHVHLSAERATAIKVGSRHGAPIVLLVDAATMAREGHQFYLSDNGVWLTESVPPQYLRVLAPTELQGDAV